MTRNWLPLAPVLFTLLQTPVRAQNVASSELGVSIFQSLHQHAVSFPPAKIFIFGDVFEVGMLEPQYMAGNDGITLCAKHLILLNARQSESEMRAQMTHELLHAITCPYGGSAKLYNSKNDKTHQGIYFLAPKLAYVWEHNPRLSAWMGEDWPGRLPAVDPAAAHPQQAAAQAPPAPARAK
jgi:hypothetical protein